MGRLILFFWAVLLPGVASADTLRLAVAANALPAARALADAFTRQTGDAVSIAHGASGKIYAQIVNGAPFDIFLSADRARPVQVMQDRLGHARKPYAIGRLALVGPAGADLSGDLSALRGKPLAIADPALAPYGVAAVEALENLGLTGSDLALLRAENIGQVAVWLATGNAGYGVLAVSLLPDLRARRDVSVRRLEPELHAPIIQDAVWLISARDAPAAERFWEWLDDGAARAILSAHGFDVPVP